MTKNLIYDKILSQDSSFQLVRTNPKLTGNVKISINSDGNMWLNSIPSIPELAKDEYSRFAIDLTQSLPSNIYRFFKNGETPNEIIFSLFENVDLDRTSKDYKDQFDFSNYFSGVKYFPSNKYEEKLSYFAPIYLKDNIPNYFIILKIKDPINYSIDEFKQKAEVGLNSSEYLSDLFKNASIIKTFDLTENSPVGQYLRSYITNPIFPVSPLTVSFDEDQYTTWNGILINEGVFGERGELLYEQYQNSTPLKFFEENITLGYQRNGVIFPNILNLEFLFSDDSSEKYEINRYIGFYVNSIELSELDIDLERGYAERGNWPNSPRFRTNYLESDDTILLQENQTGVVIPYKNLNFNLTEFSDIFSNQENFYFNYLTDRDSKFYLPKLDNPYDISYTQEIELSLSSNGLIVTATSLNPHLYDTGNLVIINSADPDYSGEFLITKISDNQFEFNLSSVPFSLTATAVGQKELDRGKITISNTRIDLGKFFGPSKTIFLQDSGFVSEAKGFSSILINLTSNLQNGDYFKIYHPTGTRQDVLGKYDKFTATINHPNLPNSGDFYAYNDFDEVTGFDIFYFNGTGLLSEISSALASCINSIRRRSLTAYSHEDTIIIKSNSPVEDDSIYSIEFVSPIGQSSSVQIDDLGGTQSFNNKINFSGGSKSSGNRLVINGNHLTKILLEQDNLLIRTNRDWSKIKKVSRYSDLINEKNFSTSAGAKIALADYRNKIVITLEDEERPFISYGDFVIRRKFRPEFGIFSFFPIKDLDFDFYSSQYLNFPLIDFYQYYFIPEETTLLFPGNDYIVSGGVIEINGVTYQDTQFTVIDKSKYSIVSGNPLVTYYTGGTSGESLIYPITDQNLELNDFSGFSILKDPSKVVPQQDTQTYLLKEKYFNGLTQSEYDFYKENEVADFALKSKVIPYISKWGIKNGSDSRGNPYRLNTEIIFGKNNFSPDEIDKSQNPDNFTHEWFYIESKFNYTESKETIQENFTYFDKPLDITKLLNDPEYFIEYFTYTPTFQINNTNTEVAPTQFRYSNIFKNRAGKYETFFKGFKISFKDVNDPTVIGEDGKPVAKNQTARFEDYKFSCILKPVKEDFFDLSQPPVKYKVVEHSDFKFILVIIEVSLGSLDQIEDYWKEFPFLGDPISLSTSTGGSSLSLFDPTFFSGNLPFETVNGDYRISFDVIDGLDISNLSHALIYSLKNKKFNSLLNNFSNVKLSSKLQISSPTGVIGNILGSLDGNIQISQNQEILNYPFALSDEVVNPTSQTFISAYNNLNGEYYFIDSVTGLNPNVSNPITSSTETSLIFTKQSGDRLYLTTPTSVSPLLNVFSLLPITSALTPIINQNFIFYFILGGEKYFEKLFQKISFSQFKDFANSLNPIIEFESYSLNQNKVAVLSSSPNFYFEILDSSEITKVSQIINQVNEDRPTQFSFEEIISYNFEEAPLQGLKLRLNRYKGEYEPLSKDILYCNSSLPFTKNNIGSISLANVQFNINIDSFFKLTNFNHVKVSPIKILDLEEDQAFFPRYEKIGEISVGRADYFLLSGNWDWGFHKKYLNKTEFIDVPGSLRVEEDENFLGKIISLPEEIELEQFNVLELQEDQLLTNIDLSQIELVVKEGLQTIDGYINLNNVLTRFLIEDGISQKFDEFLVNSNEFIGNFSSIEEYVKEYIKINILRLYSIKSTEFFAKENANLISSINPENANSFEFNFLSDQQRFVQGYRVLNSVGINNYERLILSFRIQKPVNSGLNLSPKIKINFI
jgi:hypothetical protein